MITEENIISPTELVNEEILEADGYIQSLIDESQWYGGYPSHREALDAQQQAQDAQAMALKIRNDFELTYAPIFTHRKRIAEENFDYWASIQWTDQDIANLLADGLPPYVANIMKRQADTTMGEQRSRETDWRAVGRNPESDRKRDFQNHFLRSMAQQNDWGRIKADCFRDSFIGGVGVASAMLDPADPKGNIRLQRNRPVEFMFHLETARNGSLDDTEFLWRGYFTRRNTLLWEFPMWADQIRELQGAMYASVYPYLDTLIRPKSRRTSGSSAGSDQMVFDPFTSRLYRQMLFKREFYHRRKIPKWRVTNGYTATHYDFDTKAQAEYCYSQLCEIWKQVQSVSTGFDPDAIIPKIANPRIVEASVVDQQIWIGDTLVAVNTSDVDLLPYEFCIPEYVDGMITSYFEHGKDMQRLRNIAMTVMHKRAASFKGKLVINMHLLGQDMTEQKVRQMLMQEMEPLLYRSPNLDASKAITHIPPPGNDSIISQLLDFSTNDINYAGGGLNAVGLPESANESGIAVNTRQQAAALAQIPLMDEFGYFDRRMGERVLYLGQYIDLNIQFMAVNEDGDPQFMSMADAGIQDISEMRYQVEVINTRHSPTERSAEANRLKDLAAQGGETVAMALMPLILKKEDIDKADRDVIEAALNQQQQFQQQLQMRQEARADAVEKIKWELAVRDRDIKEKELELELLKIRTPNVSLNVRPEPSPGLVAAIVNQSDPQANADTLGVLTDQAIHAKFRQDVIDTQQVHQQELMTPEERKIQALKASGKSPTGQNTAKDAAARSNK